MHDQTPPTTGAAVRAAGVLVLDVRGVAQYDRQERRRRWCAVNRTSKSVSREDREVSGVIQMGVREQDRVDGARVERRAIPVAQAQGFQALKQPALQQHLPSRGAHEILRAGDGPGSTEEG